MSSTQQLLLGEGAGGAAPVYIEDVFSTYLYVGNDTSQTITNNIDLSTKGGLVWIKSRSGTYSTGYHVLNDTVRGAQKALFTNTTGAENTGSQNLTAFTSTGFSVGNSTDVNGGTTNMVSWTFREQPKFFDVVTYTGNGTGGPRAIAHSLGSIPGCYIVKRTDGTSSWPVYHRMMNGGTNPQNYWMALNTTSVEVLNTGYFGTAPTSTNFYVADNINANGAIYVAYLFAHDAGGFGAAGTDNVISCGSYTGTGSTLTVTLGYEIQWLLVKRATGADANWILMDVMRGLSYTDAVQLSPNTTGADNNAGVQCNPIATGFEITSTGSNLNNPGNTYIYIAIRRGPMKVPTSGTSVFDADFGNNVTVANTSVFSSAITTDLLLYLLPAGGGPYFYDRLRGGDNELRTSANVAETTGAFPNFDAQTGVNSDTTFNFTSRVGDVFRRAPGYFDIVCFTGTKPTVQTVTHNLGVVPELLIVKNRGSAGSWRVWNTTIAAANAANFITLNTDYFASPDNAYFNSTAPTASVFTVGTDNDTNMAGVALVAYLFATCAGVSKVGSYTGTGTTLQVNCGFTAGSRFIMIKRTDSTGDWYIWDSARGITAGNDPYILLNSNAAEVTGTDYVDTYSAGFEISSTAPAAINANGGTFIFLAIA